MNATRLSLITTVLELNEQLISWPKEVGDDAYTLVYNHSHLQLNQSKESLNISKLYEAWAFDGQRSWHIWQRDIEWVCTSYDVTTVVAEEKIEVKQYLAKRFRQELDKDWLVIHQTLAYDEHGQAYIVYACPIDLKKEGSYAD